MGGFLLNNAPLPVTDRLTRAKRNEIYGPRQDDPHEGLIGDAWADFMSRLVQSVQHAATRISSVSLEKQQASIAASDLSGSSHRTGVYRLTWFAIVTTPGTVSSSLTVTVSWTTGGIAQSFSGAAMTGNTTTTHQSETYMVIADATAPIRYETVYASVGATAMQYRLVVTLEAIQV